MQSAATDSLTQGCFLEHQGYLLRSCPANIATSLSPCLPAASRREGEDKKDLQKAASGTKADVWWRGKNTTYMYCRRSGHVTSDTRHGAWTTCLQPLCRSRHAVPAGHSASSLPFNARRLWAECIYHDVHHQIFQVYALQFSLRQRPGPWWLIRLARQAG